MRFIGDYLNGDEYFKLKEGQPEDLNLKRGLVQLHLAEDMNAKEEKMKSMVKSIVRDFNLNIDVIINESDRKPKKSPTKHENYNKNILTYCEKRNISKATIDYVGVKENDK